MRFLYFYHLCKQIFILLTTGFEILPHYQEMLLIIDLMVFIGIMSCLMVGGICIIAVIYYVFAVKSNKDELSSRESKEEIPLCQYEHNFESDNDEIDL